MMLEVRGFTPIIVVAAVALGVLASLVSGAFAAIVWVCFGGDALAAFIVGGAAVPMAVAGGAAWSAYAGRRDGGGDAAFADAADAAATVVDWQTARDKPDRARRPGVGELDVERALRGY